MCDKGFLFHCCSCITCRALPRSTPPPSRARRVMAREIPFGRQRMSGTARQRRRPVQAVRRTIGRRMPPPAIGPLLLRPSRHRFNPQPAPLALQRCLALQHGGCRRIWPCACPRIAERDGQWPTAAITGAVPGHRRCRSAVQGAERHRRGGVRMITGANAGSQAQGGAADAEPKSASSTPAGAQRPKARIVPGVPPLPQAQKNQTKWSDKANRLIY